MMGLQGDTVLVKTHYIRRRKNMQVYLIRPTNDMTGPQLLRITNEVTCSRSTRVGSDDLE